MTIPCGSLWPVIWWNEKGICELLRIHQHAHPLFAIKYNVYDTVTILTIHVRYYAFTNMHAPLFAINYNIYDTGVTILTVHVSYYAFTNMHTPCLQLIITYTTP